MATRKPETSSRADEPTRIDLRCSDEVVLGGNLWIPGNRQPVGQVIINCATGVLSRYYHRYARFLSTFGLVVLTYDYRGIGLSRPKDLRTCGYTWRDWGEKDFEAAVSMMRGKHPSLPLSVIGHSIGGFLPGLAANSSEIDRMLTVGAQFAWRGDYACRERVRLILKWHVAMPAITAICGYFPGRKLGWLEDLPKGVALEWAFRRSQFALSYPKEDRGTMLMRMASITAPILAVVVSDDEIGTIEAVHRTLSHYENSDRTMVLLKPSDLDCAAVGHFGLFRDRHINSFWHQTIDWLLNGENPWPYDVAFSVHNGAH
jgi:predicted alpha/beta hydrolase